MTDGKLERRWHVVCPRCGDWDIPSGTKKQAEATLRESHWERIGFNWICSKCINRAETESRAD